jgi:hypothetical protein
MPRPCTIRARPGRVDRHQLDSRLTSQPLRHLAEPRREVVSTQPARPLTNETLAQGRRHDLGQILAGEPRQRAGKPVGLFGLDAERHCLAVSRNSF